MPLTTETRKKLQFAATEAIMVQNASNFSGVFESFHQHVETLRQVQRESGEYFDLAKHPVTIMFLDKLSSLAGTQWDSHRQFSKAIRECELLALDPLPAKHNQEVAA
jgi:hypothetical protein